MALINSSIALVVVSTDSFCDTWPIFFRNLNKFWGNCTFPKYLITDSIKFEFDGINTINPEKDEFIDKMDWGGRLLSCLNKIKEENVLLIFEDYVLINNVNEFELTNSIEFFINNKVDFLTLGTHDFSRKGHVNLVDKIVKVESLTKYKVTTSPGIWRKNILSKYLIKGLNPWQFEILGTVASIFRKDNFYMLNIFYYNLNYEILPYFIDNGLDSAIVRGKWQKSILKHVDLDQIDLINKRGVTGKFQISKLDTLVRVFSKPFFVFKYILTVILR
jgi:hypothetical protein